MKALREKYFCESEMKSTDYVKWKPDEVHEVQAKRWESVDVNSLPPILVIGIYKKTYIHGWGIHVHKTK